MTTLLEEVVAVAAKAKKYGDRRLGEQNTKASLIEPILGALGWDTREPDEVHREYRPQGKDSPVDYALKLMRKPRLFVEAKGLGETMTDRRWIAQVLGYATVAGVEWCVLTDGDEYRFYNAAAPVDADDKMFCRVKLTESTPEQALKALSLLSRKNLEQNLLDVLWVTHFVDRRVKKALDDLTAAPNRALVALVRRQTPKLTPKEIADSIRRLEIKIEIPAALPEVNRRLKPAKPATDVEAKPAVRKSPSPDGARTTLAEVISAGLLRTPLRLFRNYKETLLEATLLNDGTVEFQGANHPTCSTAAEIARGSVTGRRMNTNGWVFWQYADGDGNVRVLDTARQQYLKQGRKASGQPALRLAGKSASVAG